MSGAGVRVGVGTRFQYDGEVLEVVELLSSTTAGGDVLSKTIAAGGEAGAAGAGARRSGRSGQVGASSR